MNSPGLSIGSRKLRFFHPFFLACLCLLLLTTPVLAQAGELGPPPVFPKDLTGLLLPKGEKAQLLQQLQVLGPLSVNPQNREASRSFYNSYYLASGSQTVDWTGNHDTCNEGTTAASFQDAVVLRVNYFRAMGGVPAPVTLSTTYSGKDQKAALMMSVNDALSHSPPPSWDCYSADGAEAAGNSNLALGANGWEAISLYIQDPGAGNGAAGHRRWILYPQTQNMGTGDVPQENFTYLEANALWVFDAHIWDPRPTTREEFVAWPPPGYVPYQVVYGRWSFSYANGNFSGASVAMSSNGVPVSVTLEPVQNGYGENTLVWIPAGYDSYSIFPRPAKDTTYNVTVSNVVIGGTPHTFNYAVTVFDPETSGAGRAMPWLLLLLD